MINNLNKLLILIFLTIEQIKYLCLVFCDIIVMYTMMGSMKSMIS